MLNGEQLETETVSDRFPERNNHTARLGLDYQVNDKFIIGGLLSGYNTKWVMDATNVANLSSDGVLDTVITVDNHELNEWKHLGGNINLQYSFAANKKEQGKKYLSPGALIRIQKDLNNDIWHIVQLPAVEAAIVSLDPNDGAVRALVGGFDFQKNKFNHVTQAWRQPGSSFKPFIYSAALEKGFTPATIINDGPLSFNANQTGSQLWEPKNFDGKYDGPVRMRTALVKSKNLVSIRILQAIGVHYAQDYISRFGFDADTHHLRILNIRRPFALG